MSGFHNRVGYQGDARIVQTSDLYDPEDPSLDDDKNPASPDYEPGVPLSGEYGTEADADCVITGAFNEPINVDDCKSPVYDIESPSSDWDDIDLVRKKQVKADDKIAKSAVSAHSPSKVIPSGNLVQLVAKSITERLSTERILLTKQLKENVNVDALLNRNVSLYSAEQDTKTPVDTGQTLDSKMESFLHSATVLGSFGMDSKLNSFMLGSGINDSAVVDKQLEKFLNETSKASSVTNFVWKTKKFTPLRGRTTAKNFTGVADDDSDSDVPRESSNSCTSGVADEAVPGNSVCFLKPKEDDEEQTFSPVEIMLECDRSPNVTMEKPRIIRLDRDESLKEVPKIIKLNRDCSPVAKMEMELAVDDTPAEPPVAISPTCDVSPQEQPRIIQLNRTDKFCDKPSSKKIRTDFAVKQHRKNKEDSDYKTSEKEHDRNSDNVSSKMAGDKGREERRSRVGKSPGNEKDLHKESRSAGRSDDVSGSSANKQQYSESSLSKKGGAHDESYKKVTRQSDSDEDDFQNDSHDYYSQLTKRSDVDRSSKVSKTASCQKNEVKSDESHEKLENDDECLHDSNVKSAEKPEIKHHSGKNSGHNYEERQHSRDSYAKSTEKSDKEYKSNIKSSGSKDGCENEYDDLNHKWSRKTSDDKHHSKASQKLTEKSDKDSFDLSSKTAKRDTREDSTKRILEKSRAKVSSGSRKNRDDKSLQEKHHNTIAAVEDIQLLESYGDQGRAKANKHGHGHYDPEKSRKLGKDVLEKSERKQDKGDVRDKNAARKQKQRENSEESSNQKSSSKKKRKRSRSNSKDDYYGKKKYVAPQVYEVLDSDSSLHAPKSQSKKYQSGSDSQDAVHDTKRKKRSRSHKRSSKTTHARKKKRSSRSRSKHRKESRSASRHRHNSRDRKRSRSAKRKKSKKHKKDLSDDEYSLHKRRSRSPAQYKHLHSVHDEVINDVDSYSSPVSPQKEINSPPSCADRRNSSKQVAYKEIDLERTTSSLLEECMKQKYGPDFDTSVFIVPSRSCSFVDDFDDVKITAVTYSDENPSKTRHKRTDTSGNEIANRYSVSDVNEPPMSPDGNEKHGSNEDDVTEIPIDISHGKDVMLNGSLSHLEEARETIKRVIAESTECGNKAVRHDEKIPGSQSDVCSDESSSSLLTKIITIMNHASHEKSGDTFSSEKNVEVSDANKMDTSELSKSEAPAVGIELAVDVTGLAVSAAAVMHDPSGEKSSSIAMHEPPPSFDTVVGRKSDHHNEVALPIHSIVSSSKSEIGSDLYQSDVPMASVELSVTEGHSRTNDVCTAKENLTVVESDDVAVTQSGERGGSPREATTELLPPPVLPCEPAKFEHIPVAYESGICGQLIETINSTPTQHTSAAETNIGMSMLTNSQKLRLSDPESQLCSTASGYSNSQGAVSNELDVQTLPDDPTANLTRTSDFSALASSPVAASYESSSPRKAVDSRSTSNQFTGPLASCAGSTAVFTSTNIVDVCSVSHSLSSAGISLPPPVYCRGYSPASNVPGLISGKSSSDGPSYWTNAMPCVVTTAAVKPSSSDVSDMTISAARVDSLESKFPIGENDVAVSTTTTTTSTATVATAVTSQPLLFGSSAPLLLKPPIQSLFSGSSQVMSNPTSDHMQRIAQFFDKSATVGSTSASVTTASAAAVGTTAAHSLNTQASTIPTVQRLLASLLSGLAKPTTSALPTSQPLPVSGPKVPPADFDPDDVASPKSDESVSFSPKSPSRRPTRPQPKATSKAKLTKVQHRGSSSSKTAQKKRENPKRTQKAPSSSKKPAKPMPKIDQIKQVASDFKAILKPHYLSGKINKEEYKEIMRKAVPQICQSRSGANSTARMSLYADQYVNKVVQMRKYLAKKMKTQQQSDSKAT